MPDDHYTTLLKAPEKASESILLSEFYSKALAPVTLLGLIPFWYGILWPKNFDAKFLLDKQRGNLYGLLIIFTFVMGLRLIQSILLAQQDYRALEAGVKDVVIFLVVLAFTAGGVFRLFPFGDAQHVSLVYLGFAIVGTFNFRNIYRTGLAEKREYVDYVIERRIQLVNILTFVLVTISMVCVWIVTSYFPNSLGVAECAVILTWPALILNMMHSDQLTLMPRFLFTNAYDARDAVIGRFRILFRGAARALTDEKIRDELLGSEYLKFQRLSLVRAEQHHVPQLVQLLLDELDYLYEYIFASTDVQAIRNVLNRMLRMYGGFGSMGYNHFYAITTATGDIAGFVLMDSKSKASVYSWFEWLVLVPLVGWNFGWWSLPKILGNSDLIICLQPQISSREELCVANLLIARDYRRQGYGTSVVRLLQNALAEGSNRISAKCILALVRSENAASLALFEREGFRRTNTKSSCSGTDPFRHVSGVGEAIFLKYDLIQRR